MIAQEVKEERRDLIRKGFKPFIRANSMSSSSGSVATVTMNTIRRMVNVGTRKKTERYSFVNCPLSNLMRGVYITIIIIITIEKERSIA